MSCVGFQCLLGRTYVVVIPYMYTYNMYTYNMYTYNMYAWLHGCMVAWLYVVCRGRVQPLLYDTCISLCRPAHIIDYDVCGNIIRRYTASLLFVNYVHPSKQKANIGKMHNLYHTKHRFPLNQVCTNLCMWSLKHKVTRLY